MKAALLTTLSLLFASPFAAVAQVASVPPLADPAYTAGTRALQQQRWPDALHDFTQVVQDGGTQAEGALYWKAYCLNKMSRHSDTAATCEVLRAKYPASSWNSDCATLTLAAPVAGKEVVPEIATSRAASHLVPPSDGEEDLKLLALNSLAEQNPARAMPILRGILSGDQSPTMKEHAIFVLTQSRSPEAAALLKDVISGKLGAGLQKRAIPLVAALGGHTRYNDQFSEVYRTTTDPGVKQAVISALFLSGDAARMVAMARSEKDLAMKRAIVAQLALMNDKIAQDYMLELLK